MNIDLLLEGRRLKCGTLGLALIYPSGLVMRERIGHILLNSRSCFEALVRAENILIVLTPYIGMLLVALFRYRQVLYVCRSGFLPRGIAPLVIAIVIVHLIGLLLFSLIVRKGRAAAVLLYGLCSGLLTVVPFLINPGV